MTVPNSFEARTQSDSSAGTGLAGRSKSGSWLSIFDQESHDIKPFEQLNECTNIVGDILSVIPPMPFIIVDGLDKVGSPANSATLRSSMRRVFDAVYREGGAEPAGYGMLKTMFSTNRPCMDL